MSGLLIAELIKLRTVRSFWGYLAALVGLAAIGAAGTIGSATDADRARDTFLPDLAAVGSVAGLIALVLGIVVVTSEFRHGTITPTLLVTPARERVLAVKWLVAIAAGTALAILALVVVAAVTVPWLSALGDSAAVDGETGERAARVVLQSALWAAIGVAIGTAVQGQVAALLGALIWFLVAEPLLSALLGVLDLDGVVPYLPNRSFDAVLGGTGEGRLSFAGGLAVAIGWIVAVGALGVLRTERADIT
ncbi:MAG TPA: ABC transporter permease subunit [Gaiellaceae bacterium]|nr:ABC transporter permease subunit [Gaiellaceae bacterium]